MPGRGQDAPGLLERLGLALILLWLVTVLSFLMLFAMPGDPVLILLAEQNVAITAETVAAVRAEWGLDRSLPVQYLTWLQGFLVGDWGNSFRTERPIVEEFARRLPVSLALGFGGIALALILAVPLGFRAALHPHGLVDRMARGFTVLTQAVPAFWLGLVAIWVFAVALDIVDVFTGPLAERLVLPILLIALYTAGSLTRVYRAELLDAAAQPMFRTARAKGLSRGQALWRHGHRRALFGLAGALTPEFGWVVGGTAVTEVVFGLPGISQFLVESIGARDYFVLQAYVVVIALGMLLVAFAVTALRRGLDPTLPR